MCAGRSTGFTKPNYRAIQTAFLTTHFSDRATDTLGAPRSHTACTPGSRDMNPSSLTPEPVLNRPLENTSPAASSNIYHTSLQIQRAYVFPGPDFQPRCRENKTILLSRSIGRPPGLRSKAAQHSPASTQSPGSRCAAGSAGVAPESPRRPGESRDLGYSAPLPASVSLPGPPAGGLRGASRLWSSRPLNTHPSAARLPAPLTLEGGCSRDAHHRGAQPAASATRCDPPPESSAGAGRDLHPPNSLAPAPPPPPPPLGRAPPRPRTAPARPRRALPLPDQRTRKPGPSAPTRSTAPRPGPPLPRQSASYAGAV